MALVGAQIAVALTLLASAGLLVKALHELSRVDPGFRPEGVYASHIILGGHYRRDLEARRVYFKQLVENVRALPGVSDAALSTTPPIPGLGEAPIGRELELFLYGETRELEVIGGSADTRFDGLDQPPRPALFLAHPQMPFLGIAVVARTSLGPATYGETLRRTVQALDPSQLVLRVESLEEALSGTLAMERFYSILLGLFAAVALTLAASGIYGVFAYWVRQRQREMGLRIALGASPSEVRRLVLSRGVAVTVPSLVAGLGTALALSKALSSTFRGVDTVDPPPSWPPRRSRLPVWRWRLVSSPRAKQRKSSPRWLSAPNSACDDCFHRTLESPHRILVLCRLLDDGLFGIDAVFPSSKAASCSLLFDADNDLDFDLALIDEIADEVLIMIHRGAASETAHRPVQ